MDPTASPPPTTTSSGGDDLPDHPGPKDPTTAATTSAGGDDLSDHLGPRDSTTILKGKRTKRQRPITTATTTTTTIVSHSLNSSPTSSSDHFQPDTATVTATAEDHDTANSLILLSQGQHISNNNNNNSNNNYINSNNIEELSGYKFNSKRYIQMSADGANGINGGIYVYECKTCSRTFPSFQALGGHRASHKKPRVNEPEKRRPPHYTAVSDDDDPSLPQFQRKNNNSSSSSSLSLQLTRNTKKYSSSKLHDCAICGAEFNSGQALGGHMRRHRAANGSTTNMTNAGNVSSNTNTTLSLTPYSPVNQKSINDGLCLDLDLNLPAPPEMLNQDQHRDSSFKFTANPTHTLVDCHY